MTAEAKFITESPKQSARKLRDVAVFLSTLSQRQQTEILSNMPVNRAQKLSLAISSLGEVSADERRTVLGQFKKLASPAVIDSATNSSNVDLSNISGVNQRVDTAHSKTDFHPKMFSSVFQTVDSSSNFSTGMPLVRDASPAEALADDEYLGDEDLSDGDLSDDAELLESVSIDQLASALKTEDPQSIAQIFYELSPEKSAALLTRFDIDWRLAILRRIANQNTGSKAASKKIFERIRRRLKVQRVYNNQRDGMGALVQIMSFLEPTVRQTLIDCLTVNDLTLARQLSQQCISINDLVKLTDAEIKKLLSGIDTSLLAPALSNGKQVTIQKILKNMAPPAAAILNHEIDNFAAQTPGQVSAAQDQLLAAVYQLKNDRARVNQRISA